MPWQQQEGDTGKDALARGGRVVLFAILGKQSQDGLGLAHQILKQKAY